jgi:hypothetical protein
VDIVQADVCNLILRRFGRILPKTLDLLAVYFASQTIMHQPFGHSTINHLTILPPS